MQLLCHILAAAVALAGAPGSLRSRDLLDKGWKFMRTEEGMSSCTAADFPEALDGMHCYGLVFQAQVTDQEWCQNTCCGDPDCEVWQWCPAGGQGCPSSQCWTGKKAACKYSGGWISRSRTVAPSPAHRPDEPCRNQYCQTDYDDRHWRTVDLPHDMVLENSISPKGDKSHGYLLYGKGWYRLKFFVPIAAANKSVWIDFDGVQRNSLTYLNGKRLGRHLSGYTPFSYDVSDSIAYGEDNVLAVMVDATGPDSWWYDGGGIYRHVWLNVASRTRVAPWGVYLPAQVTGKISETGRADAKVTVQTTLLNDEAYDAWLVVRSVLKNPGLHEIAAVVSFSVQVRAGASATVTNKIPVLGAQLWSDVAPHLYTCETTVKKGTMPVDSVTHTFGIRKMEWDPNRGFILNNKPTKVRGFANHQDFAGVGVAVPDSLQAFRVWKLKQMGANAWRTAHNPPTPALLDECDRQGMLVWDENHRNRNTPEMVDDLKSLILRDRNHPSVILWSLCNEALCEDFNVESARSLKPIIKELDPMGQRPVTAAMNGAYESAFQDLLDVMGVNYAIDKYDPIHASRPMQPMIGSETSSDFSDRSVYANDDKVKMYVSAEDVNYPLWGNTAEDAWCAIKSRDFVAGGFYWTGFDYKGEPTPYGWPNVNSHFGVIDEAGFPKDNYFYHQSVFFTPQQKRVIHLFPHWNWDQSPCAGLCKQDGSGKKVVDVWAYTNGDAVELFLNNRSLGRKGMTPCRHVSWKVPYVAGELRAVAHYQSLPLTPAGASPVAEAAVATTGKAVALALEREWPLSASLTADDTDTALVTVKLVDHAGRMVPIASAPLSFSLSGPGKIIGLGNGDPSSHEPDRPKTPTQGTRSAWNGLCRVVVQASAEGGTITLRATGPGLRDAQISIVSLRKFERVQVLRLAVEESGAGLSKDNQSLVAWAFCLPLLVVPASLGLALWFWRRASMQGAADLAPACPSSSGWTAMPINSDPEQPLDVQGSTGDWEQQLHHV